MYKDENRVSEVKNIVKQINDFISAVAATKTTWKVGDFFLPLKLILPVASQHFPLLWKHYILSSQGL